MTVPVHRRSALSLTVQCSQESQHRRWAMGGGGVSQTRLTVPDPQLYIEKYDHPQTITYYKQTQKLTDWSNKWQMNFNTSKCHLLTITHKPKPSEFTYTIANQPISRVDSHPYLSPSRLRRAIALARYRSR